MRLMLNTASEGLLAKLLAIQFWKPGRALTLNENAAGMLSALKSVAGTSLTQCAANSTVRGLISVPVHTKPSARKNMPTPRKSSSVSTISPGVVVSFGTTALAGTDAAATASASVAEPASRPRPQLGVSFMVTPFLLFS